MPHLEDWSLITAYTAATAVLSGKVRGHHRFPDGQKVYTSLIIGRRGERIVTKSGSEYTLGDIDPSFQEQSPGVNYKELILAELSEVPEAK